MNINVDKPVKILAISGSLRTGSSNTSLLRALVQMAPRNVEIKIYEGLGEIPPFSPESDGDHSPEAVQNLRSLVKEAHGIIISTPEYAFGVPGVLKNALDWTVSTGEFNEKPVSSVSASPLYSGGDKALASLLLTLTALGTIEASSLSIPCVNKKINEKKEVVDLPVLEQMELLLTRLIETIKDKNINL